MKLGTMASAALACLLAACIADDGAYDYDAPVVQNCYRHGPLDYTPILVRFNIGANYNLSDPQEFRRYAADLLFDAFDETNPGKYKVADGVTPNLILNITITNDGFNHYGAILSGDGNGEGFLFNYTWGQAYATGTKLYEDIADQVNAFITQGWHRGNC